MFSRPKAFLIAPIVKENKGELPIWFFRSSLVKIFQPKHRSHFNPTSIYWVNCARCNTYFFFLSHGLFRSVLLYFQVFENFHDVLLLLIYFCHSQVIHILCIIPIFWKFFRLVLWPSIYFLVHVPLQLVFALCSVILTETHAY